MYALKLGTDAAEQVVADEHWHPSAVSHELDCDVRCGVTLPWRSAEGGQLVLYGDFTHGGFTNPAALALAGEAGRGFYGPLLVVVEIDGKAASLAVLDLLVLGTRLLMHEASYRAIEGA